MEIGLTILLFVCMTALLYVVLSLKITRQVDLQMKEFYKTRIHTDIQEFYREMEGYAGLLEARIKQFKSLVERNEEVVRAHEAQAAPIPQQAAEPETKIEEYMATEPLIRRHATAGNKAAATKKPPKLTKAQLKAAQKAAKASPRTKSAAVAVVTATKGRLVKPETPPARQNISAKTETRAPVPRPMEPQRFVPPAQSFVPPVEPAYTDTDDSAIAEELMKDLFAQDQVRLSAQPAPKKPEATASVETAGERTTVRRSSPQVANFFSRIGKSVGPIVFGEKPAAAETQKKAEPVKQPATVANTAKPVADFSEVLRRAEQIKAEKKAERERAEVEARAEFYAVGDTMSPTAQRQNIVVPRATASAPTEPAAPRQSLAVKDLDQHTINFLIDSLKQENGYRKQALRALTENNIPLPEIARLSKIDIGELELMRQLGRF